MKVGLKHNGILNVSFPQVGVGRLLGGPDLWGELQQGVRGCEGVQEQRRGPHEPPQQRGWKEGEWRSCEEWRRECNAQSRAVCHNRSIVLDIILYLSREILGVSGNMFEHKLLTTRPYGFWKNVMQPQKRKIRKHQIPWNTYPFWTTVLKHWASPLRPSDQRWRSCASATASRVPAACECAGDAWGPSGALGTLSCTALRALSSSGEEKV